jgi:hypothetical protein
MIKSRERWNTYSEVFWAAKARLMIQMVIKKERLSNRAPKKPTGICNFI